MEWDEAEICGLDFVTLVELFSHRAGAVGTVSEETHVAAGRKGLGRNEQQVCNRFFNLAKRETFLPLETGHVLVTLNRRLSRFFFRLGLRHGFPPP
jgi:hypothetical protein